MSSRFKMGLAELRPGDTYSGLSMRAYDDEGKFVTLIPRLLGEQVDYAKLFAYLFRRFGYPNVGWDSYKDLVHYLLSTPLDDMILSVRPYVGDSELAADITFGFLVTREVEEKIRAYDHREHAAYHGRMLKWVEANVPIPDWMPTCIAEFRAHMNAESWRDVFFLLPFFSTKQTEWHKWYLDVVAQYAKVEKMPALQRRPMDWRSWPDEDPLKKYVEAAEQTFCELKRPVSVRDMTISAFPNYHQSLYRIRRHPVAESPVAGYPSGALGNAAPEGFSKLHNVILDLGDGDMKRGIEEALTRLSPPPKDECPAQAGNPNPAFFAYIKKCGELLELAEEETAALVEDPSWYACFDDGMDPESAVASYRQQHPQP